MNVICGVFDRKKQKCDLLLQFENVADAIRAFSRLCMDEKSLLHAFPADFCLMCFGKFSGDTLIAYDTPEIVDEAKSYFPELDIPEQKVTES